MILTPIRAKAERQQINLRYIDNRHVGISLDETTTPAGSVMTSSTVLKMIVDPVTFFIDRR